MFHSIPRNVPSYHDYLAIAYESQSLITKENYLSIDLKMNNRIFLAIYITMISALIVVLTVINMQSALSRALESESNVTEIRIGVYTAGVAVNSNSNMVYVTRIASESDALTIIDGNTSKVIKTIPVKDLHHFLDVNQNTNKVYVTNDSVTVIDGNTSKVIKTIPVYSSSGCHCQSKYEQGICNLIS